MTPRPDITTVNNAAKRELIVGSRTCQCASCEEFFASVTSFDKNLTRHDNGNLPPTCKTAVQMRAAGLETNVNGVWQTLPKVAA